MENLRKRMNVKLINNAKDFLKYTSRPTYITHKIFGKDYAAIHEIKPVLILNKPIYVGFTVLDLSKWKMYDFHYNFIKKNFDAELLFTDTDSLTYEIKSKNVYEEFFKWKDLFDFSNYSKDSRFFDGTNKNVIGRMKDEFGGIIVSDFIGLKSKMYSIKKIDGKESNTAKGVNIATEFNEFKNVLLNKKIIRHKMKRIQAKKHKIGTYEIDKISLSCFDGKRYVSDGGIHTLAYFHKDCDNKKRYNHGKTFVIVEKICHDGKIFVIMEKICHDGKIFVIMEKIAIIKEVLQSRLLGEFQIFYKEISHTKKA